MRYEKFIEKVLDGKSVNARAKELGIPTKTLDNYASGRSVPSCAMTMKLAKVAGVALEEAVIAVAEQELVARPKQASSFLRPAVAAVLTGVVSVNMFLTPTPAQAASVKALSAEAICIM